MKLLLFDIDGTLLLTNGAGTRAANRAFENIYGISEAMTKIDAAGKTDPIILKEIFMNELNRDYSHEEAKELYKLYIPFLEEETSASETTVMPGIPRLLENLSSDFHKSLDDILNSSNAHSPGKLLIDHFLEQVHFWIYDLNLLDCTIWFEICRDPIAIVIVFDWATPKTSLPDFRLNVKKILQHYCFNDLITPMKSHIPVLLLINESDQKSQYSKAEFYDLIKYSDIDLSYGVAFVSIEKKRGIDAAFSWIAKSLLF